MARKLRDVASGSIVAPFRSDEVRNVGPLQVVHATICSKAGEENDTHTWVQSTGNVRIERLACAAAGRGAPPDGGPPEADPEGMVAPDQSPEGPAHMPCWLSRPRTDLRWLWAAPLVSLHDTHRVCIVVYAVGLEQGSHPGTPSRRVGEGRAAR